MKGTETLYMCCCVSSCDSLICVHPVDVKFFTGLCAGSERRLERNLGWERNRYNREKAEKEERGEEDSRHRGQQIEMEEKREGGV